MVNKVETMRCLLCRALGEVLDMGLPEQANCPSCKGTGRRPISAGAFLWSDGQWYDCEEQQQPKTAEEFVSFLEKVWDGTGGKVPILSYQGGQNDSIGFGTVWNTRFLSLAQHVAQWSKDPSTKCGAVLVRPDKTIASLGFNGFPIGVHDKAEYLNDRGRKLDYIIHAEMNAILFAGERLNDTILFSSFFPCVRCAVHIAQVKIAGVIAPPLPLELLDRWGASIADAKDVFKEAGVWWRTFPE